MIRELIKNAFEPHYCGHSTEHELWERRFDAPAAANLVMETLAGLGDVEIANELIDDLYLRQNSDESIAWDMEKILLALATQRVAIEASHDLPTENQAVEVFNAKLKETLKEKSNMVEPFTADEITALRRLLR